MDNILHNRYLFLSRLTNLTPEFTHVKLKMTMAQLKLQSKYLSLVSTNAQHPTSILRKLRNTENCVQKM